MSKNLFREAFIKYFKVTLNVFFMQPFNAVLSSGRVIIPIQSEADSLNGDGYGKWNKTRLLVLDAFETLYNVERGKLTVIDEENGRTLGFRDLLNLFSSSDPKTLTRFIVYKDLRTRGFVTQRVEADEFDFQVYDRGTFRQSDPSMNVFIISEGSSEQVEDFISKVREAQSRGVELKLAVVDRRGEIVYYSLSEKKFY
jgi:tRNA-intron endonuclease